MTEAQQTRGLLETILRELDNLKKALAPKRASLTRQQFADATGYNYKTVQRWIASGRVRLVEGRIPADQLDQFLT